MVFKDEDPDMRELAVLENEACLSKIQELRQKVKPLCHTPLPKFEKTEKGDPSHPVALIFVLSDSGHVGS